MKKIIHPLIRFYLRIVSAFFFETIEISGKENLPPDCPVILASNHPNAFLDSIVMTTCTKRYLYYTARGDFFRSKIASALLRYIQILPLFRKEEGLENLHKNGETFLECMEILKKNGVVSIFSEGISENEWNLRVLRKGTARLAYEAWSDHAIGDKLKVVPVVIHYSSWLKMFPRVYVEFLENIEKKSLDMTEETGFFNKLFNEKLKNILDRRCIIVDKSHDADLQNKIVSFILKNDANGARVAKKLQDAYLQPGNEIYKANYKALGDFLVRRNINYDAKASNAVVTTVLFLCSCCIFIVAWLYNFIPYLLSKLITRIITKENDFHDSLMYSTLVFIYPVYLLALFFAEIHYNNSIAAISYVLFAIVSAYSYENCKRTILSFWKRKKLVVARQMFSRLFEISNG